MFMGTTYNSIDEKNRMIVPSKLRAGLGSRCVLTKGLDRCLYIYTMEDWEKQMQKIAQLPESDPKVRAFIRHFCANAAECEFDKQGRIGIPQELKAYAGIEKDSGAVNLLSEKIFTHHRKGGGADLKDLLMEGFQREGAALFLFIGVPEIFEGKIAHIVTEIVGRGFEKGLVEGLGRGLLKAEFT